MEKSLDIARVFWRDSSLFITQHGEEVELLAKEIESIGFVIKNNKDVLAITGDLIEGEKRRTLVIPKENITALYINDKLVKK